MSTATELAEEENAGKTAIK